VKIQETRFETDLPYILCWVICNASLSVINLNLTTTSRQGHFIYKSTTDDRQVDNVRLINSFSNISNCRPVLLLSYFSFRIRIIRYSWDHKEHIYLEYHRVCRSDLLLDLGPPNPSTASECAPPPLTKVGGWGTHSPAGEGVGKSQFGRLEKKPSTLSTLCMLGTKASKRTVKCSKAI
jgi:hypothetical protein